MKKKSAIWIVLLFLFTKTTAQNNLPPAYEIKSDTGYSQRLDSLHWQMLEDPTGGLTVQDVSKPPFSNSFHLYNSAKSIDYSINTYWFRYVLKNSMSHDLTISFSKYIAYLDIYTIADGKWKHQTTGLLVPWSKRDGLRKVTAIPFTLKPGEELIFYERDKFNYIYSMPFFHPGFTFTDRQIADNYINNDSDYLSAVLHSLLFGVLIIGVFLNGMFYEIVREREYLFFSLSLLFMALSLVQYNIQNVLFKEHPFVGNIVYFSSRGLFTFFILHFFRYLLKTFYYYPKWDNFLLASSFIMMAGVMGQAYILPFTSLSFITQDRVWAIMQLINNLPMLFILITLLLFVRNRDKSTKIKIISALPLFLFWGAGVCYILIVYNLWVFYHIKYSALSNWINNWNTEISISCTVWFVLVFSSLLFQRYQKLRNDLINEALEKERLEKEKEIERSQLIEQQKIELEKTVEERTAELKQSLQELKSTQSQLIQQEKMASLGELTAGIAHEIQNPLNFVNNFSEVNKELIEELKGERQKAEGERSKELEDEILNDIDQNLEKVSFHGKRADAIVKGMLQHSKISTGKKEPAGINALCDEYLRLSYHGLRAKDKSFNADFTTNFDESIGNINIVPEDIGRVLLNLFNNAFYAVNEKKRKLDGTFEPVVNVSTKKENGSVVITVVDNGNGISQKIVDKIFQPFFTTKPTGQGTGLGLSLSYDIIKAHGGEIRVETKEGEGSAFVILLPS